MSGGRNIKFQWVLMFLALFVGLNLALEGCGDDDDDGESGESGDQLPDGYHAGLGQIFTVAESGMRLLFPEVATLLGGKNAAAKSDSGSYDPNAILFFDLPTAEAACKKAGELSGEDWRLPSISNFRGLIRGCPETEWGGSCGVYDDYTTVADCWSDDCNFACALQGPGPGIDGCYATHAIMSGVCGKYWTRAAIEGSSTGGHWTVVFVSAMIMGESPDATDQMRVVCKSN